MRPQYGGTLVDVDDGISFIEETIRYAGWKEGQRHDDGSGLFVLLGKW